MSLTSSRRIIVGESPRGRSTVRADAEDIARIEPGPGYLVQELWWQGELPATKDDRGGSNADVDIEPPATGALVRLLTIHPVAESEWTADLHGDDNRHVLTLVSGKVDLLLEEESLTMQAGDTVVLSGHVHDWRNTFGEPAVLVYTTFPLHPRA